MDSFPLIDLIHCRYYDNGQLIEMFKCYESKSSVFGYQKFLKYRGKLLAYLNSLDNDFDAIVCNEIENLGNLCV